MCFAQDVSAAAAPGIPHPQSSGGSAGPQGRGTHTGTRRGSAGPHRSRTRGEETAPEPQRSPWSLGWVGAAAGRGCATPMASATPGVALGTAQGGSEDTPGVALELSVLPRPRRTETVPQPRGCASSTEDVPGCATAQRMCHSPQDVPGCVTEQRMLSQPRSCQRS